MSLLSTRTSNLLWIHMVSLRDKFFVTELLLFYIYLVAFVGMKEIKARIWNFKTIFMIFDINTSLETDSNTEKLANMPRSVAFHHS